MGRIANLTEKPLAGAEIVVNAADNTAGYVPADEFADAAQGALADTAVQPADIGTAAAEDVGYFATAAQGALADSAVQPGDTSAAASKATPVDADEMPIQDSAASFALKKLTWANLKATVKAYFDTLYQPVDGDLTAIGALSPSNDDFMQRKAGAWANRTPTQATADLIPMVADSGAGGAKGLVPAPSAGDAAAGKFLKADATWAVPAGGGGGSGDVVGPASSTDASVAGFDGTTGKLLKQLSATEIRTAAGLATSDSPQFTGVNVGHATDTTITRASAGVIAVEGVNVLLASADIAIPTVITVPNTGLHLLDTNASHDLIVKPGSDLTADRTLTITTGDANRTLTLNADTNISTFAATFLDDADAAAVRTTLGISGGDTFGTQLLHVRHELASGGTGGSSTATTWNTRPLNTVKTNEIASASLSSNQVSLPSGTYYAEAFSAHGGASQQGRLRLYNVTDSSVIEVGEKTFVANTGIAVLTGARFTIAGTKSIRLEHYTSVTQATTGLGDAASIASTIEVFGDLKIWKVA